MKKNTLYTDRSRIASHHLSLVYRPPCTAGLVMTITFRRCRSCEQDHRVEMERIHPPVDGYTHKGHCHFTGETILYGPDHGVVPVLDDDDRREGKQ